MKGKEEVFPTELCEDGRRWTTTHSDRKAIQKAHGENNIASAPYLMGRQPELKLNEHLGTESLCQSYIL